MMEPSHKSESPLAGGEIAEEIEEKQDAILASGEADSKALATLTAKFAMAGHEIYELASGGFLVSRWGLSRECPDVRALLAFARQIGVRP